MKLSLLALTIAILALGACASSPPAPSDSVRQQAQINTSLGREYMTRGQYEIALDKLKKAINADPEYAPAHTVIAVLYERIGEAEKAEQHYRSAVEAAPANGDVNNNYGVFLCKNGSPGKAVGHFLKAIDDPFYRTPAVAYANAGACELQGGNLDKAERFLRQSLEYDAEFADALLPMANIYYQNKDYFRARAFLQRYEGAGPDTADSLALGFRIETGLQNREQASAYLQKLMSAFPESSAGGASARSPR
jgi:type IV pilus assembly protein PilF